MARTDFKSVGEYIASRPEFSQPALARVRNTIRKALPKAEEGISYQIPAYRLHGRVVIYFAGWTGHYSLYPISAREVARVKGEPAAYKINKSTIRFPFDQPVPVKLIAGIAKLLADKAAERGKRTAARVKKP